MWECTADWSVGRDRGVRGLAKGTLGRLDSRRRLGVQVHLLDVWDKSLQELGENLSVEVNPDSPGAALLSSPTPLPRGSRVFVNMVKTTVDHFQEVAATSRSLSAAGYRPVPHVPVSRLSTDEEFQQTLQMLTEAGATEMLLVGGNDIKERQERGLLLYGSVAELLQAETGRLRAAGIRRVALAGLPDSPTWRGWNEEVATKVLLEKVRLVLEAGLDVEVVTQFCFNPFKLLRWLTRTHSAMEGLRADLGGVGSAQLSVGLPGPTQRSRLLRISDICQVPSQYAAPSMFQTILQEGGGPPDFSCLGHGLQAAATERASRLERLGPPELALLLSQLSELELEKSSEPAPTSADALGPSAFVSSHEDAPGDEEESLISPEDLLWSVAAFAQRSRASVSVNLYPFGGLSKSLVLAETLRSGRLSTP
ncbi:metF [Symbiodinium natans]|uniref:MetF protein n=1 Tax=Symbiodinium natans TaxID=878477 RepID=A0A812KLG4_9DINO|nr:metF [Symbiodinium natans]